MTNDDAVIIESVNNNRLHDNAQMVIQIFIFQLVQKELYFYPLFIMRIHSHSLSH